MTDGEDNLVWYGEYSAWDRLKKDERVYKNSHPPFRFQNQYADRETGLHYNFFGYYEPEVGGENLYWFAPSASNWIDQLGWIYWEKDTPKSANWRLPKDGTWTGSSIGHALSAIPDNAKIKFEIV